MPALFFGLFDLAVVSGYFMMHFHRMLQTCNWAHTLLYFNGEARIYTHDWQGGDSHWRDDRATLTYPLGANQQFWARVWNGCWTNWHTGECIEIDMLQVLPRTCPL